MLINDVANGHQVTKGKGLLLERKGVREKRRSEGRGTFPKRGRRGVRGDAIIAGVASGGPGKRVRGEFGQGTEA